MSDLAEAKEFLRRHFDKGVLCPCCGQRVQRYKFKFNSGMARALIEFRKVDDWLHAGDHFSSLKMDTSRLNLYKIKFWGLLESKRAAPGEDKNASGFHRITDQGRDFVDGKSKIKSHCYFFNNKALGLTGEDISIQEALGKRFSYRELMGY